MTDAIREPAGTRPCAPRTGVSEASPRAGSSPRSALARRGEGPSTVPNRAIGARLPGGAETRQPRAGRRVPILSTAKIGGVASPLARCGKARRSSEDRTLFSKAACTLHDTGLAEGGGIDSTGRLRCKDRPMSQQAVTALTRTLRGHVGLGKSRLETLCMLVVGMIGARTVNLGHVASERPGAALTASTYRRLQRFFQ